MGLALLLLWAATGSGPVVLKVEATTRYTDSLLVVSSAGIEPGDILTPELVASAIKRVYRLGLYSQVGLDTFETGDGVRLRFWVEEYPRLKSLEISGNRKVRVGDIKKRIDLKEGEILSGRRVFELREEISRFYKEKGYLLADVRSEVSLPDGENRSTLKFLIDEGEAVRIRSIEIKGNEAFPDRAIERRLKNREKRWYRSGRLKEEEFKQDLDRIVEFYRNRGHLDAKVEEYDIRYDAGWAEITIQVYEGPRYRVGKIEFAGNRVIPVERLKEVVRLSPGGVYNLRLGQESLKGLYELYGDEGHIYAQISPSEEVSGDTVHIRYEVREGEPAQINRVIIQGNDRTHEKVIRRMIATLPGNRFRRQEVIRSQREIFNLGFFEDVRVDYREVKPGEVDLIYEVKEKPAGQFTAGATYSAQYGVAGNFEISQPNLFGQAKKVYLHLEKGGKLTNAELGLTDPWFLDTPTSAGFNIFYLTRVLDYYDKHEQGVSLHGSHPLPLDFTRGHMRVRVEDVEVRNIARGYRPVHGYDLRKERWPKRTISTLLTLVRDSRDYIYNPISGSRHAYSIQLAGGPLGGQVDFYKQILDSRLYFPLFWKFTLGVRTRWGMVDGYKTPASVPVYERFYLGGAGEDGIRGYPERSVGPREDGYNIGGRAMAIVSIEYRLRLSQAVALLAFFDAGNTWRSFREVNLSDLHRGLGVGVRVEIPLMGMLGFDLGYGLDRRPRGFEPHFQTGAAF